MPRYFFILGRNPELSLAELHAILPVGYKVTVYSPPVLIIDCPPLDANHLMKRLGGTVKIGEIIMENVKSKIENILRALIAFPRDKKLFLGFSAYPLAPHARLPNVRELRELGIEIKRALQTQGYKVRLVTSKKLALSSVIVKKEKLLNRGAEIVMFYAVKQFLTPNPYSLAPRYIGHTLAVQEFEEASLRDYGRPERSMGVGMLPIQLTKIMINLARMPISGGRSSGHPEDGPPTILDPFCGLGTVLMEALQMGYIHLIGTDLEQTMIDATRRNLEWLAQNKAFSNPRELENVKLLTTPVERLSKHLPPHSVDTIVTEPHMGPTRKITNHKSQITNLCALYINAFREFVKIMKPGGRVVFIFPAFKHNGQITKTSDRVLPEIKKLGFSPLQLLPTSYLLHPTHSITYSRPDQRVRREIFVLEFKK